MAAVCHAAGLGGGFGAYAFGRLLGKHKMAPRVSPGKTTEGLAGGLITAGLVSLAVQSLFAVTDTAGKPDYRVSDCGSDFCVR